MRIRLVFALFVLGAVTLVGCSASYLHLPRGVALAIPRGNPVEADIEAGYRTYGAMLERWGRWSDDPLYSVHWCPRGIDAASFVPYQSEGHWAPSATNVDGSPYWMSDDAETWGEVTMHHGWWIRLDRSLSSGLWCWVPGVEETAARVVWGEADGFVAWAPEPPLYADVDESDADLSWAFELLGTLFDHDIAPALLQGDAAGAAYRAAWAGRRRSGKVATGPTGPSMPRRTGPTASTVAAARRALSGYVAAHPVVASDGSAQRSPAASSGTVSESGHTSGSAHTAAFHSEATTSSAPLTTPSSHFSTSRASSETAAEDSLPPSMALYSQMIHDPFVGSVGGESSPSLPIIGAASRVNQAAGAGVSAPTSYQGSAPAASSSHSHASSAHSSTGHSSSHSSSHSK